MFIKTTYIRFTTQSIYDIHLYIYSLIKCSLNVSSIIIVNQCLSNIMNIFYLLKLLLKCLLIIWELTAVGLGDSRAYLFTLNHLGWQFIAWALECISVQNLRCIGTSEWTQQWSMSTWSHNVQGSNYQCMW